jgi:predicted ATPase
MAQEPFLKSIRPVNLLSFGPDTQEIELRSLNILIGPNGCGKSNLVEIVGLLQNLTEEKPWTHVTETGGVKEWVWKDAKSDLSSSFSNATLEAVFRAFHVSRKGPPKWGDHAYRIELNTRPWSATFLVGHESMLPYPVSSGDAKAVAEIWRDSAGTIFRTEDGEPTNSASRLETKDQMSALSIVSGPFGASPRIVRSLSRIKLYREWTLGSKSAPRNLEQAGRETTYLEEDNSNLAHVLNFILTHQDPEPGRKLREALKRFSGDAKDVDTRLQEGFVQLRIRESSGISVPAIRLSDGTLRWLALLTVLLNPDPPPVTCIEEPELGLHPDILPTLADLLVDASTRTQLIITTHSRALLDSFTDVPEAVCVCEKVEGSTVIQRLEKDRLKVWLDDYSLGKLWTSGEIGGNRW